MDNSLPGVSIATLAERVGCTFRKFRGWKREPKVTADA